MAPRARGIPNVAIRESRSVIPDGRHALADAAGHRQAAVIHVLHLVLNTWRRSVERQRNATQVVQMNALSLSHIRTKFPQLNSAIAPGAKATN